LKKIRKGAGPACQWPTTPHGRVSRPAHAHAHAVTPRWVGHRPPPRAGAVDRATCLSASTCSTCSRRLRTLPCALSSHFRGPKEKPISFLSLTVVAELLPLHSISHRPPLLQASSTAATSSCAYVSSSTGGQLGPSRPPLGADRMPHDAAHFLDGTVLTAVSHLRPRSEAISFPPSSTDSSSSSPTDPTMVSGR
jgi:hypothetical protein